MCGCYFTRFFTEHVVSLRNNKFPLFFLVSTPLLIWLLFFAFLSLLLLFSRLYGCNVFLFLDLNWFYRPSSNFFSQCKLFVTIDFESSFPVFLFLLKNFADLFLFCSSELFVFLFFCPPEFPYIYLRSTFWSIICGCHYWFLYRTRR